MVADKGMLPADQEQTFESFMFFGSTTLLSFIIFIPFTDNDSVKFLSACLLSAPYLALLGLPKARIDGQSIIFSVAVITLFSGWPKQSY